jgi:hypothetical protein
MPVDIDAAVIANRRLSADYNVLSFAAPEIAATARPGQFVMVKTSGGRDPLLRRPFSIFEILRDAGGHPSSSEVQTRRVRPPCFLRGRGGGFTCSSGPTVFPRTCRHTWFAASRKRRPFRSER